MPAHLGTAAFLNFTQHERPETPVSAAEALRSRSPFVPVKKHYSPSTPPSYPALRHAKSTSALVASQQYAPVNSRFQSPISNETVGGHGPLRPTSIHNTPSVVHRTALTAQRQPQPLSRKILDTFSIPSQTHLDVPLSPPRIRAKLTPSATPRRKVGLPGAEYADYPATAHQSARSLDKLPVLGSPNKRTVISSASDWGAHAVSAASSSWPTPLPIPFPTPSHVDTLTRELNGLGLDSTYADSPKTSKAPTGGKDNVLVCLRVRPAAAKLAANVLEHVEEQAWDIDSEGASVVLKTTGAEFSYDSVVTGTENESVYQEAGKALVSSAMEGFDAVIFAYGQTASGKTFTLTGNAANPGIIPQAVSDIFCYIRDHPEKEFLLRASYLEIYNETLKDLLAPETGPLKIRQDEKKKFFVHPLREEVVTGEAQVAALLRRGAENRHTGQTDFNERSSRSHSVFQMTIESRNESSSEASLPPNTPLRPKTPNGPRLTPSADGVVRMSKLSLIDLAGSEQATSQLERRNEGAFINKSLLTLEKVIASLTDESKRKPHVPYRDSKLTQILQPSLSGDARVAVIATMNPAASAIEETKSTLKFAQRIKKVVLKAVVNEVVDDKALITKYRSHIAMLEAQLSIAMTQAQSPSVPSTPSASNIDDTMSNSSGGGGGGGGQKHHKQSAKIDDLNQQLEDLKSLFLTSGNMEVRRQSMLPPRAVSPIKKRSQLATIEDDETTFEERYMDGKEEITLLKDEVEELRQRITELEDERLEILSNDATESDKDARIVQLTRENRELQVINQNTDLEAEIKRQEKRHQRQLERCKAYESGLEATLAQERQRVKQFERYILQQLLSQADAITGRRRSSMGASRGPGRALSVNGGLSLMTESPDLDVISPAYVEIDDLQFSAEGMAQITKSASRMQGLSDL